MTTFLYTSNYAQAEVRGTVREAILMPKTFAAWGKAHLALMPAMGTWTARHWLSAFLQDLTSIPWLVTATDVDFAEMPRHDPTQRMQEHEHTTDIPLLNLPPWLAALTKDDVAGSVVVNFITQTLLPFSFDPFPSRKDIGEREPPQRD